MAGVCVHTPGGGGAIQSVILATFDGHPCFMDTFDAAPIGIPVPAASMQMMVPAEVVTAKEKAWACGWSPAVSAS